MFIVLGATIIAAAYAETGLAETSATLEDVLFRGIPGVAMDDAELAGYRGGDVYMELNERRDRIKVTVTSTDPEAKLGIIPKREVFYVDAHNRVVDTTKAGFMPTSKFEKEFVSTKGLTSKPEQFPEGSWAIGHVSDRSDKFGPHMMMTNAVGRVMVYDKEGKFLGRYEDTGYAIYSNKEYGMDRSKSWGCVIGSVEDNAASCGGNSG